MGIRCLKLFVVIAIVTGFVSCQALKFAKKRALLKGTELGLSILSENNATIYISHDGLYELDINSGKWFLKMAGRTGYDPQEAAIGEGEIYFGDMYKIYAASIYSKQDNCRVLANVDYPPSKFAVSHDGKKLAYCKYPDDLSPDKAIMILDIDTGVEQELLKYKVESISWAIDDSSLFVGTYDGIFQLTLDGKDKKLVDEGFSPKAFSDNCIIYYKGENEPSDETRYIVFYKKNLLTNTEKKLFRFPVRGFQGATWDPTGRFAVLSVMTMATNIPTWIWTTASPEVMLITSSRSSSKIPPVIRRPGSR